MERGQLVPAHDALQCSILALVTSNVAAEVTSASQCSTTLSAYKSGLLSRTWLVRDDARRLAAPSVSLRLTESELAPVLWGDSPSSRGRILCLSTDLDEPESWDQVELVMAVVQYSFALSSCVIAQHLTFARGKCFSTLHDCWCTHFVSSTRAGVAKEVRRRKSG